MQPEEHHWFKAEDAVIDPDTSDWDKGCPSLLMDELFAMNKWLRGLNYGAQPLLFLQWDRDDSTRLLELF